jgi:hypothetical protein
MPSLWRNNLVYQKKAKRRQNEKKSKIKVSIGTVSLSLLDFQALKTVNRTSRKLCLCFWSADRAQNSSGDKILVETCSHLELTFAFFEYFLIKR